MIETEQWGPGEPSRWRFFDEGELYGKHYRLFFGAHPHSRNDNDTYALFDDGHVEEWAGHRVRTKIVIEEENYLKESELSGDEIRRGGNCTISFNDRPVYGFFTRDARDALIKANQLLIELREHPVRLDQAHTLMEGRKVYYRGVPGTITYWMGDQGAVSIVAEDGQIFPRPTPHEEDWPDSDRHEIKEDILSQHIWWFRD